MTSALTLAIFLNCPGPYGYTYQIPTCCVFALNLIAEEANQW